MKSNIHKKVSTIDRFARKFYCQHARLNQLRLEKKFGKRKFRRRKEEQNEN